MSSKYDDYWAGQLPRIRAQLQVAADGMPASVGVPGLTRLGERHSWYGVTVVRMREMAHGSGAHATSLGKTVAASGICTQWPERVFRFTIGSRGDVLSITAAGSIGGSAGDVPGRIFMSYRREETAYPAAWLFDRLASRFGRDQVFKDVDSIEPGDDFAEVITTAVESCDVLLALIGRRWLTIADQGGRLRLDDPGDFVRLEIEAALARIVRVIPILVDGARMPRAEDLPPSLARLTRRQALELSPAGFDSDTQRLLRALERTVSEAQRQVGRETDRVTADLSGQEHVRLYEDGQRRAVTKEDDEADRRAKEETEHEATPPTVRAPRGPVGSELTRMEHLGNVDTLQFRLFTGEQVETAVRVGDIELPAGEFLIARKVWLDDGTELRQHRPASGYQRRDGCERLDNEIIAGRGLHEVVRWGSYPSEVARLYGDGVTSADPYALFEPYWGQPLRDVGTYIIDDGFDAFVVAC